MMEKTTDLSHAMRVASAIGAEMTGLSDRNTPKMRAVRRKYSRSLKPASPEFMLYLASKLLEVEDYR